MAIQTLNSCVLCRDFYIREPQSSPSSAAGCGGWASVTLGFGAGGKFSLARRGGCGKGRGDLKSAAFWTSKPSSVEMEEIAGMEEMDEALRLSQELSQPIIVDWIASWCRKCIYLKPKLEKLAADYHPSVIQYWPSELSKCREGTTAPRVKGPLCPCFIFNP